MASIILNKKITVSLRSLVAFILVLVLFVIAVGYLAIFHLGILEKTVEDDNPNTEKVYKKSNKVIISNIKPSREQRK